MTYKTGLIILLVLLFAASNACADSIMVHGLSYHPNDRSYNEVNTGIGYRAYDEDGVFAAVGTYRNSVNNQSVYIGGGFKARINEFMSFGIAGGFVSGYPISTLLASPELSIQLAQHVSLNVIYFPEVAGVTAQVFGFSLEITR